MNTHTALSSRPFSRLALLAAAGVLLALPALVRGFPKLSHDGTIHAIASSRFADQLWRGERYPRWIQEMNGGFGSPMGFYYAPVAYSAASLFRPLFPKDVEGWMPLGASAGLALVGSGVAAYPWLRQFADPPAALAGSLSYLASPYHVAVDLYLRGAIAELWAFVWMPLGLYFAGLAARKPAAGAIGLAVCSALLLATHPPTALLFSVVPLAYGIMAAARDRRLRTGLAIGASLVAGTGLAAAYLMPALTTQGFVQMERMSAGALHYANHFLFGTIRWSSVIGKLSVAMAAMAGLAVAAWAAARRDPAPIAAKQRRLWLAVAAGSFALMIPASAPIWRAVPLLQKVQFPFRLGTVLTAALAALVALAVAARSRREEIPRRSPIASVSALLLAGACGVITLRAAGRAAFPEPMSAEEERSIERRLAMARGPAEYFPRWAGPLDAAQLAALRQRRAGPAGDLVAVTSSESATRLAIREWKPRRIGMEVDGAKSELTLSRFYFPGWTARAEDGRKMEVRPSAPDGLLQMRVPGGRHSIVLELTPGAAERAGQWVSAASALLLFSAGLLLAWRRRRVEVAA